MRYVDNTLFCVASLAHTFDLGKTAVSVALKNIFKFGHTQSDDVVAKKPAPVFIKNVVGLLKDKDVVIADKYVTNMQFRAPAYYY